MKANTQKTAALSRLIGDARVRPRRTGFMSSSCRAWWISWPSYQARRVNFMAESSPS